MPSTSSNFFTNSKNVCSCFLLPNSPLPSSPIFTPVKTISLIPLDEISLALLITFSKVSLLEIPLAKGEFGNKKHEHTFLELVKKLDEVEGIHRLRISSIEPNLLKDETIDFVSKSNSFVPHFHIPLQSGSDELLKKMKRRYLLKTYTNRVAKIKEVMPNACIGVDVIVGFPGETDELFLETYNYLNEMNISYLHVFTYSERPNTEAVNFEGTVPKKIRAKRSKMLRGLSAKKRRSFYESQLGNTATVLFENENKEGFINGFTENYVKVKAPWNPKLANTLKSVILTEIDQDGLVRITFVEN